MADPQPYVLFPGTAREILTFYGDVFGCAVQLHTFAEFNRADGPADAIAHGGLYGGAVSLSCADVSAPAHRLRGPRERLSAEDNRVKRDEQLILG
jgi:PhnB protein